ncbi:hypothetical protein Q604_UNBC04507G0001, partial [human gut metagenome]
PELVSFFEKIQKVNSSEDNEEIIDDENISIFSLLPAYALSEIKSAFIIGFYIYLPFVVVDLVISSVLLTLGMMMMSPVTISTPIKLILFVAMELGIGTVTCTLDLRGSVSERPKVQISKVCVVHSRSEE